MPESCPLLTSRSNEDAHGYTWERSIPEDCRECLNLSLALEAKTDLRTKSWELAPDERLDHNSSILGGFCNYGIKIIENDKRQAIEEIGEEGTDELDGALVEVNTWTFDCTRSYWHS